MTTHRETVFSQAQMEAQIDDLHEMIEEWTRYGAIRHADLKWDPLNNRHMVHVFTALRREHTFTVPEFNAFLHGMAEIANQRALGGS